MLRMHHAIHAIFQASDPQAPPPPHPARSPTSPCPLYTNMCTCRDRQRHKHVHMQGHTNTRTCAHAAGCENVRIMNPTLVMILGRIEGLQGHELGGEGCSGPALLRHTRHDTLSSLGEKGEIRWKRFACSDKQQPSLQVSVHWTSGPRMTSGSAYKSASEVSSSNGKAEQGTHTQCVFTYKYLWPGMRWYLPASAPRCGT